MTENKLIQIITKLTSLVTSVTSIITSNMVKVVEQSPPWAHVLDEQPFNAQAVDGSSTAIDVLSYEDLGITITDAICDGVITMTDGLGAPLSFLLDNVVVTSFTGAGSGTNYHHCQLVNSKIKQVIIILTGRTTGSVSVNLYGL